MWPTPLPTNKRSVGRGPAGAGRWAFPQVRLVGLAECGSQAITRVAVGPYTTGETTLASLRCWRAWAGDAGTGRPRPVDGGAVAPGPGQRRGAAVAGQDRGHRAWVAGRPGAGRWSWLSRLDAGGHRRRDPRGPVTVRVLDYTTDDLDGVASGSATGW
jgi:hypothetical protein